MVVAELIHSTSFVEDVELRTGSIPMMKTFGVVVLMGMVGMTVEFAVYQCEQDLRDSWSV